LTTKETWKTECQFRNRYLLDEKRSPDVRVALEIVVGYNRITKQRDKILICDTSPNHPFSECMPYTWKHNGSPTTHERI
jgi:hypothetical protein